MLRGRRFRSRRKSASQKGATSSDVAPFISLDVPAYAAIGRGEPNYSGIRTRSTSARVRRASVRQMRHRLAERNRCRHRRRVSYRTARPDRPGPRRRSCRSYRSRSVSIAVVEAGSEGGPDVLDAARDAHVIRERRDDRHRRCRGNLPPESSCAIGVEPVVVHPRRSGCPSGRRSASRRRRRDIRRSSVTAPARFRSRWHRRRR